MHPFVLLNEEILPADQTMLKPGQLGLLAGWGVFTTLRIYRGVPFEFERHWARMQRDAALIHIPFDFDSVGVRRKLLELIAQNESFEASMRVCIVRSEGGVFAGPSLGNSSDLVAFSVPVKDWASTTALSVTPQGRHAASPFRGTKTLSWAHNLTMAETAHQAGFGETILLNERDEVAECTSANIFAVIDGQAYTPPLDSGPLPGVTREVMLEELEPPVQERVLLLEDLYDAEEVFITSSTRELMPVERIGDQVLRAGEKGEWPAMRAIRERLRGYIAAYTDANGGV